MAAFLYEGVLMFGVTMLTALIYSPLTGQHNAMVGKAGLQATLFIVTGLYFVWFWTHGGQTVAQKAWHLRVVDQRGQPLSPARATARFLLAWLWFLPALLSAHLLAPHNTGATVSALVAGILAYLLIARLNPRRQFLHDLLCGTQLITQRPAPRARKDLPATATPDGDLS